MFKIGLIGGSDHIGMSLYYIEYNKQAIIVDCGMHFPDKLSLFGVNRIVTLGSYIKNNLHKVRGLFITHMHEDHIGGIRRFLEKFNVPIYAEPLTCDYLKLKHNFKENVVINPIKPNEIVTFGDLSIRPFEVEHSTIKAFGYELLTKKGNLVLPGDFKLGNSLQDSMKNIQSWGCKENPLAVIVESTNADQEGYCLHEADIIDNIETLIRKYTNELFIITTFASNMIRLKNILNVAQKNQKDIFVLGRNMEISVKFLIEQNIVSNSRINFLGDNDKSVPDNALVLTTGCQGEPYGGLRKLIEKLKDKTNKTVLFSSSIIPGNEESVTDVKIDLLKNGFKYIEGSKLYHTSGHAKKEEIKYLITHLKPKYVIPVHGDYIKQIANKENAITSGVKEENVIVVENNSLIFLKKDGFKVDKINEGLEYITNNGVVKEALIEDKQVMAKNGLFLYSILGRYIKFSSVGVPQNCKLNRIGRSFVQDFLSTHPEPNVDKDVFKEACIEFLSGELKGDDLIPLIEVVNIELPQKTNSVPKKKKAFVKKNKNTITKGD